MIAEGKALSLRPALNCDRLKLTLPQGDAASLETDLPENDCDFFFKPDLPQASIMPAFPLLKLQPVSLESWSEDRQSLLLAFPLSQALRLLSRAEGGSFALHVF